MAESTNIAPIDWDPHISKIRVLICPLDEVDTVVQRRGVTLPVPTDSAEYDRYAKAIGKLVEDTTLHFLKEKLL